MSTRKLNYNPALNTSFKLEIPGLEEFNYFVTSAPLPGLNMSGVETPIRNHGTSMPSNRVEYDPVNITWIVSEDYMNHTQIRLWMHEFAFGKTAIQEVMKDINLFVLDSNKKPFRKVTFVEAYPTTMSELPFETGTSDATPVICNTTFRYQYYDIVNLS